MVTYPPGSEDAVLMTRREALVRTPVTRGVIDGDMTAIKLLVELLEGKAGAAGEGGAALNADQLAAAEAALMAWAAERVLPDDSLSLQEPAETAAGGGDGR